MSSTVFFAAQGSRGDNPAEPGMQDVERAGSRPTVLIVEDEALHAWHIASVFESHGFGVIGPASTLDAAVALVETRHPDVAVLDVNIRGKLVFPLARTLAERKVPIVFATAHAREEAIWPQDLAEHPRVQKPFVEGRLVQIVTALLGGDVIP